MLCSALFTLLSLLCSLYSALFTLHSVLSTRLLAVFEDVQVEEGKARGVSARGEVGRGAPCLVQFLQLFSMGRLLIVSLPVHTSPA